MSVTGAVPWFGRLTFLRCHHQQDHHHLNQSSLFPLPLRLPLRRLPLRLRLRLCLRFVCVFVFILTVPADDGEWKVSTDVSEK